MMADKEKHYECHLCEYRSLIFQQAKIHSSKYKKSLVGKFRNVGLSYEGLEFNGCDNEGRAVNEMVEAPVVVEAMVGVNGADEPPEPEELEFVVGHQSCNGEDDVIDMEVNETPSEEIPQEIEVVVGHYSGYDAKTSEPVEHQNPVGPDGLYEPLHESNVGDKKKVPDEKLSNNEEIKKKRQASKLVRGILTELVGPAVLIKSTVVRPGRKDRHFSPLPSNVVEAVYEQLAAFLGEDISTDFIRKANSMMSLVICNLRKSKKPK